MSRPAGPASSAPPLQLGPVLEFMRLIWALDHALQKTSKRMRSAIGVTGPQRLVIRIVSRFPGITPGHIAELLHVHPSTLTGILKRLEGRGLVRRRADPRDRRRAFVGITPKGRRIDAAGVGTVEAAVDRVISQVSRTSLRHARGVLIELAGALGAPAVSHRPSGGTRLTKGTARRGRNPPSRRRPVSRRAREPTRRPSG